MTDTHQVGDTVRLIAVPDWLVNDLPADEQAAIRACVGKVTEITEIDAYGYCWVGFGQSRAQGEEVESRYRGHSFCVPADCLEPANA